MIGTVNRLLSEADRRPSRVELYNSRHDDRYCGPVPLKHEDAWLWKLCCPLLATNEADKVVKKHGLFTCTKNDFAAQFWRVWRRDDQSRWFIWQASCVETLTLIYRISTAANVRQRQSAFQQVVKSNNRTNEIESTILMLFAFSFAGYSSVALLWRWRDKIIPNNILAAGCLVFEWGGGV